MPASTPQQLPEPTWARIMGKLHAASLTCVLGCYVGAVPTSHAGDQQAVEQALIQLEHDWCSAVVSNDTSALERILSDDFTEVSPAGKLGNKTATLMDAKTERVDVCVNDAMRVRVYGNVAIVVGRSKMKYKGFDGQLRFTDTFIRRDGRWQCVASQDTPIT